MTWPPKDLRAKHPGFRLNRTELGSFQSWKMSDKKQFGLFGKASMYIQGGQNGNSGPIGPTTLADLFRIGCDYYGCKFMRGGRSARSASERSG